MPPAPPEGLLAILPSVGSGRAGWPWHEETPPEIYRESPTGGWPLLTIVCPSFQQGLFIEETIRSVLLQNYPRLEFIVMDGGSRDETVAILHRYASWLARWDSQPDRGQSHALNKACDRATGELIGWINSDDYYLPGAFAAMARAFRVHGPSLLFGNWCERVGEEPGLVQKPERPAFAFQVAVGGRHLPSHATFWPRAAHQQFNEELRFTMDADFYKRLAVAGVRPQHVPEFIGVFRKHPAAKTTTLHDVAVAETQAWSRAQPWHTPLRWRFSNLIELFRRNPPAS